ncbi:MAG: hypothetical protein Q9219_001601 [cf. Caloplaca sp. 3 TL-2023]
MVQRWDNRPAKFFAGLLFAFANIGTSTIPINLHTKSHAKDNADVAGNSISFGNDLMTLFPRYINIRRGQFVCAILGFLIFPWKIEKAASAFLAFLNGYSIFLGPISGIMLTDYYILRRKTGLNVQQLYTPKEGIYWYTSGINWRGVTCYFIGMVPLLPSLIYQIDPQAAGGVSRAYINFASLAWVESTVFSG